LGARVTERRSAQGVPYCRVAPHFVRMALPRASELASMRGRLTILLAVFLYATSAFPQSEVAERTSGSDQDARRAQREAELQAALAAEIEANLLDQYMAMIKDHVQQHWQMPVRMRPGLECSIKVVQLPTGDVMSAKITQCNGDDEVRRSIENAVLRASPLPRAPSEAVFSSTLTLIFAPN